MYRIQAYNFIRKHWLIENVDNMHERDAFIKYLIETEEFKPAGITWAWLARK